MNEAVSKIRQKRSGRQLLKVLAFCLMLLGGFPLAGSEAAHTALNRLRMENQRLQKENDRLRSKLIQRQQDLLKFRQWLAVTADAGKIMTVSQRELRLTQIMKETIRRSNRLLSQISDVERLIRDLLKDMPLSPARQARILLQLDQLEKYSLQLSAIAGVYETENQQKVLEDIRLVAIDRKLETVVLSAGSVHGVFPGLLYRSKRGDGPLLRVIAVRPWVCAAVPVSGSVAALTPGMAFTASHSVQPGEGIRPFHTR